MTEASGSEAGRSLRLDGGFLGIAALYAIGLFSRVAPIFDAGGRLLRQFPTEDGYLMLTIARNLAIGRGMSTTAGTVPTNGTQPLFNFLETLGFVIVGGDRAAGVRFTLIVSFVIAILAALAVDRFARAVFARRAWAVPVGRWSGAVWFASPMVLPHTMNCLETGLVLWLLAATWSYWLRWVAAASALDAERASRPRWRSALTLGGLLGLSFWARIDVAFVIGVITLAHWLSARLQKSRPWRARFAESFVAGAVSVLIASPWLVYNKIAFGHFTPISGLAQSAVWWGQNAVIVPSKLFEHTFLMLPVPAKIELLTPTVIVSVGAVLGFVAVVATIVRRFGTPLEKLAAIAFGAHTVLLVFYYGVIFGARHFVGRYFTPMTLYTTVAMVALAWTGLAWMRERSAIRAKLAAIGVATAVVLLSAAQSARLYKNGTDHMHFQVVEWVAANVPETTWVGAVQTGTLGFFHDRAVNLDGKVNPDALRARNEEGIPRYVVDARFGSERQPIQYIVDWHGIGGWLEFPELAATFDLILEDPDRNFDVLRRR